MKFDKSKILTVVTADQAKVGVRGWFSNNIPSLNIYIERGDEPKRLQGVDVHNEYPFRESYSSDGFFACKYRYFYPVSEQTYSKRQAEWVKETGLKIGDKVKITRNAKDFEDGWCSAWMPSMGSFIGKIGIIRVVNRNAIKVEVEDKDRWYPYFVLEVVKEPTYRPFKNAEEFKPYRDKWFIDNLKGRFKIDWHSDTHIYEYGNSFITWEEAFSKYKFEDGTPFGIEVEEDANN